MTIEIGDYGYDAGHREFGVVVKYLASVSGEKLYEIKTDRGYNMIVDADHFHVTRKGK